MFSCSRVSLDPEFVLGIITWAFNAYAMNLHVDRQIQDKLWVFQAICTPLTSSVMEISRNLNKFILLECWHLFTYERVNVILLDFVGINSPSLIDLIIDPENSEEHFRNATRNNTPSCVVRCVVS